MNNTLAKKKTKNINDKKENDSKTKKNLITNHRSTISTDFSLSLEYRSLINSNKNKENYNLNNLKINKNRLIKVNTKHNNYIQSIPIRNNSKTNKNDKNESEISNFYNCNNKEKIFNELQYERYKNNINKIIYIQKWWKDIFTSKKSEYYSIIFLIKCIKKIFLSKPYNLIKNKLTSVNYFFHKWYSKMIKRIILKQILNYGYQTKRNKKYKKNKTNINKLSERNNIPKSINNLTNDSKKLNKGHQSVVGNKKKCISININGDNIKKKDNNKNICCQTTKHNNKIDFDINSMNNKKTIPISPKVTLKTERFSSPLNNLKQNINTKKSSLSKLLKKNNSKLFKNESSTKNNKKKQCQLKTKELINKMNSTKNYPKNNAKNIIRHKNNSNLDSIISNNNSKFDIKSNYEDNNSTFILYSNPKYNNNFHHDILNLNKNDITLIAYNHNYNIIEKNKYKRQKIDKKYNLLTNNNKSELHNAETDCNPIDTFLKYKGSQWNSKIYENNLYKDNKYKIFYSQEKDELPNRTSNNYNNNNGNKDRKKINNIPKNKYTILNKKEKERKIYDKEYGSYKNYIKNSTCISNNPTTINETNSNYSKLTSIENISIKTNKKDIKNILISIYFNFWKEYIDKKFILQQLTKISKFVNHINNYQRKIMIKYSMQKLMKIIQKKNLYQYIMKMIYKMIKNIMIKINEYKKRNMREIKIFKKNIYNNIYSHFHKEKGDIINNININNYIHYDDYKLLIKRKKKNPYLLSKVVEFKTTNNNFKNDYDNNIRFTLTNSNSDKFVNFWKQNLNINENKNEKLISINNYKENANINNELIKRESFGCLSSRTLNNYKINIKNIEKGVIIDQINQLKMVFNLLERHNFKKQKPNTIVDCFNKWKSFSLNIKNQSLNKKIQTPRINEKIINLKPFHTNRKIIDSMNVTSPLDISLRKNFSLTKISPKIINVINVQNFNENNNYNYNFKYMPIKDIQIYSNKLRHSCAYSNNINNINLDLNNNNINENSINTNMNNNNLNMTSFFMVNENKRKNPNIIYHKKKLGSTPINKNKFNFNYNLDNIINKPNFNNYCYKFDKNGNYDNSSLLMLEQNLSNLILQDLTNRTDNMKEIHVNMPMTPTNLRENSYNDLSSCIYPEQKFGFRKLSQIEEKEINFENINKNKKKLYIKKQHYESKKEGKDINQQNNIKSNIFENDENIKKNNFIKCLNIQFDKTCKDKFNKDKLEININNEHENNKCFTITERYFDKNKINRKKGEIFLKKNNCKQLNDNNMINTEYKENSYRSNKNINKLNSIISSKNIINEFKYSKKIKKDKINHSFERYPKNYEDFKLSKLLNNNSNISF